MSRNQTPQMIAGGTIAPSVFCMTSTAADNTVLQATAGATAAYISQVGTKYPPGSGLGSGQAADAGDDIQLFGFGDICPITVGSGAGVTHGDPLSVTTGGTAITSATPGTSVVCAYALESGAANTLVRCQICIPHLMITSEQ